MRCCGQAERFILAQNPLTDTPGCLIFCNKLFIYIQVSGSSFSIITSRQEKKQQDLLDVIRHFERSYWPMSQSTSGFPLYLPALVKSIRLTCSLQPPPPNQLLHTHSDRLSSHNASTLQHSVPDRCFPNVFMILCFKHSINTPKARL